MDGSKDYLERWSDPTYTENFIRFTKKWNEDAEKWIDWLQVDSTSTVVDLGCGEARVLAAIAPCIRQGIGVDVSAHMLASARRHLSNLDIRNVELIHADFREFDAGIDVADAVMSKAAIHHVPDGDKEEVFRRIHATLRPGGVFSLQDDSFNFSQEEFDKRVPEIITQWENHFGSEGWKFMKGKLAGDDFENTSFLEDLKHMIERPGLKLIRVVPTALNGVEVTARKPGRV